MVAVSSPTIAQPADDQAAMEEVIITARRKDESLAKVPIAVSAIGAEGLMERQVKTDSDLQYAVPGLTIRQTQGNNSLTYSIRGQSADTFSGSPSAVVTYINEVPLTVAGASTFYDLESVQVLKGPQGTLFGRNTTGGAVLYTTAKPSNENEGRLTLRAGNYDLQEAEGMINVPLVDNTLLLRGAFNTVRRDGYIDNILTGEEHGQIGRDSVRLSVLVRPSDALENTTVYSYSRTDGTNTGATYAYSIYDLGQTNNGYTLNSATAFLYPGSAAYVATQEALGPYKTQHPYGADHVGEDEILTNTTIYEFSDSLRLKNIFGYTATDTDSEQPAFGAPYPTFATRNLSTGYVGNELELESFSNELQISGEALNGDFSYIAGLYLQQMDSETMWPQSYFVGTGAQAFATSHFLVETDTQAVYAQGTYSFLPVLRVTAGLRYTEEDVTINQLSRASFYNVPGFFNKQDESFESPSWELGIEWDVTDELFTYAKTRGSFRSGGFNGSAPPFDAGATQGGNKFDKETVKDVELGLKYQGAVMSRPASLNLAIYKQWIEDVQRIEFPDPAPYPNGIDLQSIAVTANIPKMEVKGVELEATISPLDALDVGVVMAYTDAEFTDGNTTLFGVEYSYSPVANTPETTWSVWARYGIITDPGMGDLSIRAEVYGQDSMYFSNTADSIAPGTELDSYELVNARLEWANIMGSPFAAAIFGKNLTDEEYFVGGMPLGASLGHNSAAVGEPRMYGAEVTYTF